MSRVTEAIKHLKDLQHIKLEGLRFRIIDAKGQVRVLAAPCFHHHQPRASLLTGDASRARPSPQVVGRLAEQISVILQVKPHMLEASAWAGGLRSRNAEQG